MKLNKNFKQRIRDSFHCRLRELHNGIYRLNRENEMTYIIALKRKDARDCNFTNLIFNDEESFKRLMKFKCEGNYFKKVLFIVNRRFHWISV